MYLNFFRLSFRDFVESQEETVESRLFMEVMSEWELMGCKRRMSSA